MQFAHTGNNGLSGFFIRIGTEGRVFFGKLCKRDTHLFLTCLGLRLDRNTDNRFREFHRLEDDRMVFITQRIAGGGVLDTDYAGDVAGIKGVDVGSFVCVHHYDTSETLTSALGRVVDRCAGVYGTGIYTDKAKASDKGVGHDLECESGEGFFIRALALVDLAFVLATGDKALDSGNVNRRRHIVNNGVKKLLYALVFVRSTAHNGNHCVGDGRLTDSRLHFVDGEFLAAEIFLKKRFIGLGDVFNQLGTELFCLFLHIVRNFGLFDNLSDVVLIDISLHPEKIDDTAERILCADRKLDRYRIRFETIADHIDNAVEVRAHDVHFVDIAHTRNTVLVCLAPYGLRLRLNAALCAQNGYGTVQYTQRTLYLDRKVNVTGGIDDVDSVALPIASGSGGGDGDTSLLFLLHPVHGGGAVMNLAYLVRLAGIVQNSLGRRCFSRVDMRHDTDIAGKFKRILSRHCGFLLLIFLKAAESHGAVYKNIYRLRPGYDKDRTSDQYL